jgi:hypothetical protein
MINLKNGLSGCKLELINDSVIRKYSSSVDYNLRLSKQVDKQILFSNFILKNIDTPKVLNFSKNSLYYFDMEYIPGLSFFDYFSSSTVFDIDFVIETLFSYFDFLILTSKKSSINTQVLSKISSLESNTSFVDYLFFIKNHIQENKLLTPKTFCHGDLTFTNILFHKNRLFFIDFLDSYVDSFLCDLVKLKQDLFYFWTLDVQKIRSIRIRQVYKFIWDKLYQKYFHYIQSDEFKVLDAMNPLRIEPYLTNEYQRSILYKMVKKCSLYEEFNCSYGGKIL